MRRSVAFHEENNVLDVCAWANPSMATSSLWASSTDSSKSGSIKGSYSSDMAEEFQQKLDSKGSDVMSWGETVGLGTSHNSSDSEEYGDPNAEWWLEGVGEYHKANRHGLNVYSIRKCKIPTRVDVGAQRV
jgi:hypothetical protein